MPEAQNHNCSPGSAGTFERLLIEASHILNSDLEIQTLLGNILSILTRYLKAEASLIYLKNNVSRPELFVYVEDIDKQMKAVDAEPESEVSQRLFMAGRPLVINDLKSDEPVRTFLNRRLTIDAGNLVAVPIKNKESLLGVIGVANKRGGGVFDEDDLEIMMALSEQIALALANADLIASLRRKNIESQSLYEIGKLLSGKLELREILELIAEQVTILASATLTTIYLVDPNDGAIKEVVSIGITSENQNRLTMKIGEGITGWVAKTGKSMLINDVTKDSHYVPLLPDTRSELAVPIISRDRVIGVFNVESNRLNAYTDDDLALLEMFASQAAVSLERALLYQQMMDQKSLADELKIARRIQQTFLPKGQPLIEGYDIAGLNIPSEAVGGDYYDFIKIVENQLGIAIGDVSGKGMGAALIMATFRASLKAEIRNNFAIRTILSKVNELLYESIERQNYVTAVYGVLDIANHIFTYSNAGHPPPLLVRRDGTVIELTEGGYAIGMFSGSSYVESSVHMGSGECLLLYTDGVTEARNTAGEEFGIERLKKIVIDKLSCNATMTLETIVTEINNFKDPAHQLDDLTMIMIKCN